MDKKKNIGGISLKGGRKDNFYFCLLEHYHDSNRSFLCSLLQSRDIGVSEKNEAIRCWIDQYGLQELVVDFPLSTSSCETCTLECPGALSCQHPDVTKVRNQIEDILQKDQEQFRLNPKLYERGRNKDDEIVFKKELFGTSDNILSRSFRRRLKKGYLPYWNRPHDPWVWQNYYDQLLSLFNISYDSFGNTSLMLLSRFKYLRRHLPGDLKLYEGHVLITLLELLRSDVIQRRDLELLTDVERGVEARLAIVRDIEKKEDIFIYAKDVDILIKSKEAFESFILALVAKNIHLDRVKKLPFWARFDDSKFSVPTFLQQGAVESEKDR